MQIEVADHAELRGGVVEPGAGGGGFGDGDDVGVVEDELHGEDGEGEAEGVFQDMAGRADCGGGVTLLRGLARWRARVVGADLVDKVVEGDDWPGEVER